MKNLVLLFFLLFVISITCSTCKIDPNDGPTYLISDEFKSYVVFPKGSYWVFEEINSKVIDSVNLYRSELEIVDAFSKLGYRYERFTGGTSSSISPKDSVRSFGFPSFQDQSYYVLEQFRFTDFLTAPYVFLIANPLGLRISLLTMLNLSTMS